MTNASGMGLRLRIAHLTAGARLGIAILASAATLLLLPGSVQAESRAVASWVSFAIVALSLTWLSILTLEPTQIRALARREDPSRVVSLVLVLLGAGASLLAVLVLLHGSMTMRSVDRIEAIALAFSAVALAWLLIHTVFTLRYAHLYFDADDAQAALEFPGVAELPDFLDFAYFAFVVGMTSQTSDVAIHSRRLRRTALLHGVVSFAFNTSVVALMIGMLTTVLSASGR
jgi:uncharacterized membrane protein